MTNHDSIDASNLDHESDLYSASLKYKHNVLHIDWENQNTYIKMLRTGWKTE